MKILAWLILLLVLVSLACQTLMPASPTMQSTGITPTSQPEKGSRETITPPPATQAVLSSPIPTLEAISCTDDACLDACLERIEAAIPQTVYEPLTGAYAENEIEMNLVHYPVEEGRLGEPDPLIVPETFLKYQQDTAAHQAIWEYASSLLPPDQLKWITQFDVFISTNYSGWVSPSGPDQEDRSHWILGMELTYAQDPIGVTYTLVHEYGHLITLNTDQIPASDFYYGWYQNPAICEQLLTPDGCSTPDSYINLFYQRFWQDLLEEWHQEVDRPIVNSPEEFRGLVEQFYDEHSEQFVDDYAATNINEDMAESFMYFVLTPKPEGDSIPEQKIRFFYEFPELVALRQQMIQNLCSYTGNP